MSDTKNNLKNKNIKHEPKPKPNIGIDTDNTIETNIVGAALNSILNLSSIESFSRVSQTREDIYRVIDDMASDSTNASVIETYAEDVTEYNDAGQIVWCESDDENIAKMVTYLLKSLNIDKNVFSWTHSLIKYGDIYIRLYRESDVMYNKLYTEEDIEKKLTEDKVLNENIKENKNSGKLEESVNLVSHSPADHYINYVERVYNPAEMFDLTNIGKTAYFIKAPVQVQSPVNDVYNNSYYFTGLYKMNTSDITIYPPTDFVHACLDDNSSRIPEKVSIYTSTDKDKDSHVEYTVKRGQSFLYNAYKTWRQLSLLENSVMLSRATKSSILRIIEVQVANMPKEQVALHLQNIKSLMEQKSSFKVGDNITEYNSPGPIENNIYIPVNGENGKITATPIGGDYDPKELTDLNWWNNKLFAAYRVPKQYFGFTEDAAGFNGGSSLTIISSRYGKAVKRIQSVVIQLITDIINLHLIDRKLDNYIGEFKIRMQPPITQEELDRRANNDTRIRFIQDVLNNIPDLENPAIKLKVYKTLINKVVNDSDFLSLIQEQIDELEHSSETELSKADTSEKPKSTESEEGQTPIEQEITSTTSEKTEEPGEIEPISDEEIEQAEKEDSEYIPTPSEIGVSMTDEE